MKKIMMMFVITFCGLMSVDVYAEPGMTETVVSLSAQAWEEVPNDEVVIHFRLAEEGKHIDTLRKQINHISAKIKMRLKGEKGVKLETTSRRTDPVWEKGQYQGKRKGWIVVQTGKITSDNLDKVAEWLDVIEGAGAKLQGLSFRISYQLRRKTQDKLSLQAIAIFRKKAELVSKALGAKHFQVMRLKEGDASPAYPSQRNEMIDMPRLAIVSGNTRPAISSGNSRIVVNIHGDIAVEKVRFQVK